MPSELTQSVRTAINNFLSVKTSDDHGEIAIDVLRAVRDEAALLMERQTIFDTFDSDPMKFYDGDIQLMKQIERIKKILQVISCSRCTTKDGFSKIDTVVEISKDAKMNCVNESIRLTFNFQREKLYKDNETKEDNKDSTPSRIMSKALERNQNSPTHITYDIDYSKDHGESKRLVTIEVYAKQDYPSVEEAVPMDDADMAEGQEFDEHGNKMEENGDKTVSRETMSIPSTSEDNSKRDRYAAYIDPEALQDFLVSSGLDLNAENSLFFLMTFPFYEHEWDIFGFLLDCVFGGDGDNSDEFEDMTDSDGDDNDDL
mmetsp:Transcript_16702/g.25022  ORF Transcript_16702/g.25022 Transcript_16702/m.25022 type:complete len:315 (+) Transcript_16702:65-1009(+)